MAANDVESSLLTATAADGTPIECGRWGGRCRWLNALTICARRCRYIFVAPKSDKRCGLILFPHGKSMRDFRCRC